MTLSIILTHLALVVAALVFAILAGVPLGILCYFYPSARRVVLQVVDLIQTTPPWPFWALSWSSWGRASPPSSSVWPSTPLLPIVRNTHLGLSQVPEYLIEAGRGMGMTRMYRLLHVELPWPPPSSSPASASPRSTPSAPRSLPPSWGRWTGQLHHHRHPSG